MTELYHLGISSAAVPPTALLLDFSLFADPTALPGWTALGSRREYRNGMISGVLLCTGFHGAPPAVIALEELARAGLRRLVCLTRCCREDCATRASHGTVLPYAAIRDERLTLDYAPVEFPAVPSPDLFTLLRCTLPHATTSVVRTVDLAPAPEKDTASRGLPTDLLSSAVFVVGAALGLSVGTVVLGCTAPDSAVAETVLHIVESLSTEPEAERVS